MLQCAAPDRDIFSHTFTQPGLYHFHCRVHGVLFNMRGSVLVAYRDYLPFARK